jgi:hypothetical protein
METVTKRNNYKMSEKNSNKMKHQRIIVLLTHVLAGEGSGEDKGGEANHSKASIDDFSFLGKSGLHCWHVSISLLSGKLVVVGVVGVKEKRITEWKGAHGGHEGNSEGVGVGNEDDGTFVGDGVLSRDGGEGSPLLEVNGGGSIGDQSVSFAVSSGADEEPSKHSMAAVPLLSLDGRSPSPLGESRELLCPVGGSIFVDSGVNNVQRSNTTKKRKIKA